MAIILEKQVFNRLLNKYINEKIHSFHLIYFLTPNGHAEDDDVEIEFVFGDNNVLRMMTASDGERISISHEPWIDPFEEPITNENRQFINAHGKWCLSDVSKQQPFEYLIGKAILSFEGIQNSNGVLSGVAITCGKKVLCFCVDGDEGKIFWGRDNPKMVALGFKYVERKKGKERGQVCP